MISLSPPGRHRPALFPSIGIALSAAATLAAAPAKKPNVILSWDSTRQTPGLPTEVHAQDQLFFDAHVHKKDGVTASKRSAGKQKKKSP